MIVLAAVLVGSSAHVSVTRLHAQYTLDEQRALAEQGDSGAQYGVGYRYWVGQGLPQDDAEAGRWYRLAADQGHPDAQFYLGVMYAQGRSVPADSDEAARWYRLAAWQGHAAAQFYLGGVYELGLGVPEDGTEAIRWYRLAATQGHTEAQFQLGTMYLDPVHGPQAAEAVRWYRLAAAQGHVDAQYNLGYMHAYGRGVPQDDAEAVRWYRLAADQGNAGAQVSLGVMYARQRLDEQRPAAERSDSGAQLVGDGYSGGQGPQDGAEAGHRLRLAAGHRTVDEQFSLGVMYGYRRAAAGTRRCAVLPRAYVRSWPECPSRWHGGGPLVSPRGRAGTRRRAVLPRGHIRLS